MSTGLQLTTQIEHRLLARNQVLESFFTVEAQRLAEACREMSRRFLRGGRLLAFGRGPYATDAQHVSVEFVHPVIVGKRALPALDLSIAFEPWLKTLVQSDDIVMGFGPPEGDPEVWAALHAARRLEAMTIALPGAEGSYFCNAGTQDAFIHQELIEILYHTLWETVHVFFERRELGHDVGEAGFLYPFLGKEKQETFDIIAEVAASIRMKVRDDALLRAQVAKEESEKISIASRFANASSAAESSFFLATVDRPRTQMTLPSIASCHPRDTNPFPLFPFPWSLRTSPRLPMTLAPNWFFSAS
jgi:D-sedoheptulose 7-phosphate isomerase